MEKTITGVLDKEGVAIRAGDKVLRFCPNCEKGHWKGIVCYLDSPEYTGWILRDYDDHTESPLECMDETGIKAPLLVVDKF